MIDKLQNLKRELTVICVTYNSGHVIEHFLSSLDSDIKVIIVDNGSTESTLPDRLRNRAHVISTGSNIGYGSACNLGAAATSSQLLLFSNPDIRFESDSIEQLLKAASDFPNAAFNPLIYRKGKLHIRRWSRLMPGQTLDRSQVDIDNTIPVLSGACFLVRRDHFDQINGFDQNIFLFHEDDDLSARLKRLGVQLRLAAGSKVHHNAGNSSDRSPASERIKGNAMAQSLIYVMQKYALPFDISVERRKSFLKLALPYVFLHKARRTKLLGFIEGLSDRQSKSTKI
jgi:GT2 family glycosyltransferase